MEGILDISYMRKLGLQACVFGRIFGEENKGKIIFSSGLMKGILIFSHKGILVILPTRNI